MTAGTLVTPLVLSGLAFRLYLHRLVLSPEPQLQQTADLPSPERLTGGRTDQSVTAIWASDSSAVLLQYTIRDFCDVRAEFNENSFFEVRSAPEFIVAACLIMDYIVVLAICY